jgi:hypothetical protein
MIDECKADIAACYVCRDRLHGLTEYLGIHDADWRPRDSQNGTLGSRMLI